MIKIGFLDGGIGQEIFESAGKPKSPLWSVKVMLEQPDIVENVHRSFLQAGARTHSLNIYSATPTRLRAAGIESQIEEIYSLAKSSLNQALQGATCSVEKAGILPPLIGSYQGEPSRTFESMLAEYRHIVSLQLDMDLLMIETMTNSLEAKAACQAAHESGLLFTLGIRVESTGLLRSGEPIEALLEACRPYKPDGLWINCTAPEDVSGGLSIVSRESLPYGAFANGFRTIEPLASGGSVAELVGREDLLPDDYARLVLSWAQSGARLIGGCCEISPKHLKATADALVDSGYSLVKVSDLIKR